jgi:hypothetical protein
MVNTDFVFNMKSDIIFDNGSVNGAYNFDHGEAYLRMSNFPSEASALNTLAHETAHSMGYHDPGYTTSNWYAQDEADMCSIYAGG